MTRDYKDSKRVTIVIRTSHETRDRIDQAAALSGVSRSTFMLESAVRRAHDVLLSQVVFFLDDEKYAAFLDIIDNPPAPTRSLRRLMKPSLWPE